MAGTILLALTPIFFVMSLGYLAGRFNIVDNRHVDGLNVLVMNFALPASSSRQPLRRRAPNSSARHHCSSFWVE